MYLSKLKQGQKTWRTTSGEEINGIYRKNKEIENIKSNRKGHEIIKEQEGHEIIKIEGKSKAWKTKRIDTEFLQWLKQKKNAIFAFCF